MSEPVDYDKPVLLDRDKHRSWRIKPSGSFAFANNSNSLYIAGAEFPEAMKEYPIVFTRGQGGKVSPVVMLGLRSRQNLFVDAQGRWEGRYIPAFVRRYPFVLAQLKQGDAQMGVCIDEGYPGISTSEGEALFDAEGKNTAFLDNALGFLTRYQQEFARTEVFCQHLADAGVLREMNAKADVKDGRSFTVSGLLVVDEKKLFALPDDTALALFRSGELNLVAMHLASLSNMNRLVQKLAEHPQPIQAAPQPA
jgi:hypothetical protein